MKRAPLPAGIRRGEQVTIFLDGEPVVAHLGETVAAAMLGAGEVGIRKTRGGAPRGLFCGMGVCFDCLVAVGGIPNTRACMTWVSDGMDIRHMDGLTVAEGARDADRDRADA